ATTRVALSKRHHEAEVGAEQVALGTTTVAHDPLQVETELRLLVGCGHFRQLLFCEQARLDTHSEVDLLCSVQQRNLTDLLQVVLDRVSRRTRDLRRVDGNVFLFRRRDHDGARGQRLGLYSLLR